jgi:hypothetical protein
VPLDALKFTVQLAEALDVLVPYNVLKKHIDELFDVTFTKNYEKKIEIDQQVH